MRHVLIYQNYDDARNSLLNMGFEYFIGCGWYTEDYVAFMQLFNGKWYVIYQKARKS